MMGWWEAIEKEMIKMLRLRKMTREMIKKEIRRKECKNKERQR